MKKILFIAIAAIAFTTSTQAQDSTAARRQMKHENDAKMHRGDVIKDMNLTPDQQEKMKKLREDSRVKMEALKNNTSLSDEQKEEQMKALHIEQRKSMESLLTDEQKTKMKEARRHEMMNHKEMRAGKDSTMRK